MIWSRNSGTGLVLKHLVHKIIIQQTKTAQPLQILGVLALEIQAGHNVTSLSIIYHGNPGGSSRDDGCFPRFLPFFLFPFVWRKVYLTSDLHLGAALEKAQADDALFAVIQTVDGLTQGDGGEPVVVRIARGRRPGP